MGRKLKILISIIIIMVTFLGATVFFISTKIKPELIKKEIVENIEKALPGVKAKIKNIDYELGASVKFKIVSLKLTENRNKLLSFSDLVVKVPILSILKGGGTIEIIGNSPQIYVAKKEGEINWVKILPKNGKVDGKKGQTKTTNIEIPSFLDKSKINLRINKLELFLNMEKYQKSRIDVSKIIFKNINLKKSSAFELKSYIDYQLGKDKRVKTNLQIIGEVYLKELISDGKMNTSIAYNVTKTTLSGLPIRIPDLKGKIHVNGPFDDLNIKINSALSNLANIETQLKLSSKKLLINGLKVDVNMEEIPKYTGKEFSKYLKNIQFNNSHLNIDGSLSVNLENMALKPNLKIITTKKIGLNFIEGIEPQVSTQISYTGNQLNLKSSAEVFGGKIDTNMETTLNLSKIPSNIEQLNPITMNVGMTGFKVKKKLIQSILYAKKSNKVEESKILVDNEAGEKINLPNILLRASGNNIFIDKEELAFNGEVKTYKNKLDINNFVVRYVKGKLVTNIKTNIIDSKNISAHLNLIFKNINFKGLNAFFPPYIKDIKGLFKGELSGNVNYGKKLTYAVKTSLTGYNGELDNFNIAKIVGPMLSDIKLLKGKIPKTYNYSDRFEKLSLKAQASNKLIKIKNFILIGNKKETRASANGYVSMLENKSSKIQGKLYIKQYSKNLKRYTRKSDFPYQLSGLGFGLKPQLSYTAKYFGKRLVKTEIRRHKKKINAEIKKQKKKLNTEIKKKKKKFEKDAKKELKKKADKFLKGIKL